jgi:hypothetical protein
MAAPCRGPAGFYLPAALPPALKRAHRFSLPCSSLGASSGLRRPPHRGIVNPSHAALDRIICGMFPSASEGGAGHRSVHARERLMGCAFRHMLAFCEPVGGGGTRWGRSSAASGVRRPGLYLRGGRPISGELGRMDSLWGTLAWLLLFLTADSWCVAPQPRTLLHRRPFPWLDPVT